MESRIWGCTTKDSLLFVSVLWCLFTLYHVLMWRLIDALWHLAVSDVRPVPGGVFPCHEIRLSQFVLRMWRVIDALWHLALSDVCVVPGSVFPRHEIIYIGPPCAAVLGHVCSVVSDTLSCEICAYCTTRCRYIMRCVWCAVCRCVTVLGCVISCWAMQWLCCGTEVCFMSLGDVGYLRYIFVMSSYAMRYLYRVCLAACAMFHVITQRIFCFQSCLPWTGNFYLRWIKKHVKFQEPKAYPEHTVFLLRILGLAHSWIHLFTERGNPTSNHCVSYNWLHVWYLKINRFDIILYLNNDIKHGRRGILFWVAWNTKGVTWQQISMFLKALAGVLFYNLETWLYKLLAADKSVK
jgi:hypothetical protein